MYLYEINKLLQPTGTPRQLAPFAIIVFTQNGAYHPLVDAAPLPTPVKFNTPQASPQPAEGKSRLQQIINTINSRSDPPGVTTDCVRGPESPLAAAKAPVSPGQLSDQGHYLEGMPITMSAPQLAAAPPTVCNGKLMNPELEKNQELKRIVDQINARLESDLHKAAVVDPHGHGMLPTTGMTVLPPGGGGSVRSPVEVATMAPPMAGLPALQTAPPAGLGLLPRTHSLGLPPNMAHMNPLDNTHLLSMQNPSLLTPQNGLMSHQPTMIPFPSASGLGQPITSDGLIAVSRAPHLSQLRSLSCPPTPDLQFVTSSGLPPSAPTMLMGGTNAYAPLPAVHVSVPSAGLFNAMPGAYVSAPAMPSYAVQDTALLSNIVGKDLYKFNYGHLQAAASAQHNLVMPEEGYYDPYYKLQMNELQTVALQNSQLLSQGLLLRQPLKRTLAASPYTADAVKKPKYCWSPCLVGLTTVLWVPPHLMCHGGYTADNDTKSYFVQVISFCSRSSVSGTSFDHPGSVVIIPECSSLSYACIVHGSFY